MRLLVLSIALIVLAFAFRFVERRPARRWTDPSIRTDIAYWFFTPWVSRAVTIATVATALLAASWALGLRIRVTELSTLLTARGPLALQPRWLQAIEVLFLSDGLGYWTHRLFHGGRLWRFHAVHHGSEHLDWLSSVRAHPVNEALMRVAQVLPLVGLGFDPRVLAATAPVFSIYALLLHANVDWRFGPLRYAIASPAFHRWHHAADRAAVDKNFAGLFPIWDLLFGTFHLPAQAPERFGVLDAQLPPALWAQMWWPFKPGEAVSR